MSIDVLVHGAIRLPRKGRLEPGADADLVLVDRTASEELSARDLHYRHRRSAFLGQTLSDRVARSLCAAGRSSRTAASSVGPRGGC